MNLQKDNFFRKIISDVAKSTWFQICVEGSNRVKNQEVIDCVENICTHASNVHFKDFNRISVCLSFTRRNFPNKFASRTLSSLGACCDLTNYTCFDLICSNFSWQTIDVAVRTTALARRNL